MAQFVETFPYERLWQTITRLPHVANTIAADDLLTTRVSCVVTPLAAIILAYFSLDISVPTPEESDLYVWVFFYFKCVRNSVLHLLFFIWIARIFAVYQLALFALNMKIYRIIPFNWNNRYFIGDINKCSYLTQERKKTSTDWKERRQMKVVRRYFLN